MTPLWLFRHTRDNGQTWGPAVYTVSSCLKFEVTQTGSTSQLRRQA